MSIRPLALITGASSGIGYELAKCCAVNGFDLVVAADEPAIHEIVQDWKMYGVSIEAIEADLATAEGNDKVYNLLQGRPVDALLANAGHGLGRAFLAQSVGAWKDVIDTNITGTLYLIQKIAHNMCLRGEGKIMITGSIAGFMPGSYQAVYNASKAFLDSFSFALRNELKGSGVSVTCLMPGATETNFFERADMLDTKITTEKKADPAKVAQDGFQAMMKGEGRVISGWQNKMQAAIASIVPPDFTAEMHRQTAAPGSAKDRAA